VCVCVCVPVSLSASLFFRLCLRAYISVCIFSMTLSASPIHPFASSNTFRQVSESYDVDLSYILPRIMAMAFPATGVEATYRNDAAQVRTFLAEKHPSKWMLFNLSTRSYDKSGFQGKVSDLGWPEDEAPSLTQLLTFCTTLDDWLMMERQHVAAVHCLVCVCVCVCV
jgi:hypothetical protein